MPEEPSTPSTMSRRMRFMEAATHSPRAKRRFDLWCRPRGFAAGRLRLFLGAHLQKMQTRPINFFRQLALFPFALYPRLVPPGSSTQRSPTAGLLVGLVLTLAAVIAYSGYITAQIRGLRQLQ